MLDVLMRKAKGYEVVEKVQEFSFDEQGNKKLLKERISTKTAPPDIAAMKAYLEMADKDIYSMTDEELRAEKQRLIKTLKNAKKEKQ